MFALLTFGVTIWQRHSCLPNTTNKSRDGRVIEFNYERVREPKFVPYSSFAQFRLWLTKIFNALTSS